MQVEHSRIWSRFGGAGLLVQEAEVGRAPPIHHYTGRNHSHRTHKTPPVMTPERPNYTIRWIQSQSKGRLAERVWNPGTLTLSPGQC